MEHGSKEQPTGGKLSLRRERIREKEKRTEYSLLMSAILLKSLSLSLSHSLALVADGHSLCILHTCYCVGKENCPAFLLRRLLSPSVLEMNSITLSRATGCLQWRIRVRAKLSILTRSTSTFLPMNRYLEKGNQSGRDGSNSVDHKGGNLAIDC